jgi:hypothetical protein
MWVSGSISIHLSLARSILSFFYQLIILAASGLFEIDRPAGVLLYYK